MAFLEKMVVGDIASLAPGSGCLSLVTNTSGGIIDDTVITNAGDYVYMVVNGATKFGDMAHFKEQLESFPALDVTMEYLEESMQLLALQGPGAATAIQKLLPIGFDLVKMGFMTGTEVTLDGIEGCRITRYVMWVSFFVCVGCVTCVLVSRHGCCSQQPFFYIMLQYNIHHNTLQYSHSH
jgi:aminomethyltransferase